MTRQLQERKLTTEFARNDLAKTPSSASEPDRVRVIREGVASYLPDIDPEETSEWLESFDALLERSGPARARYLMLRLLERAGEQRVAIPALTSTDYVNTSRPSWNRGSPVTRTSSVATDLDQMERRHHGAPRPTTLAWASAAISRRMRPRRRSTRWASTTSSGGKSHPGGGDQLFIQGHASPGIYARAFLEGRLTADRLERLPSGAQSRRRRPAVLSAPATDGPTSGNSPPCRWAWAR